MRLEFSALLLCALLAWGCEDGVSGGGPGPSDATPGTIPTDTDLGPNSGGGGADAGDDDPQRPDHDAGVSADAEPADVDVPDAAPPDMEIPDAEFPDFDHTQLGDCAVAPLRPPALETMHVECTGANGARVQLDACETEEPIARFEWRGPVAIEARCDPTAQLPVGRHVLTLEIEAYDGRRAAVSTVVHVEDTTPPEARIGGELFPVAQGCEAGAITLRDMGEGDLCSDRLVHTWSVDGVIAGLGPTLEAELPVGAPHLVSLEVCDGHGQCALAERWAAPALPTEGGTFEITQSAHLWTDTQLSVALSPGESPCPDLSSEQIGALVQLGDLTHVVPPGGFVDGLYIADGATPSGPPQSGALATLPAPESGRWHDVALTINGVDIEGASSALEQAQLINAHAEATGVRAWPGPTVVPQGPVLGGTLDAADALAINGARLDPLDVTTGDADLTLTDTLVRRFAETGVWAPGDARGLIPLVAPDGTDVVIEAAGQAAGITGLSRGAHTGSLWLWSPEPFELRQHAPGLDTHQWYDVAEWSAPVAATGDEVPPRPLTEGLVINGVPIGAGAARSAADKAILINARAPMTGVWASATLSHLRGAQAITEGLLEGLMINAVMVPATEVLADDADGALIAAINTLERETGVSASLVAGHLVLQSEGLIAVEGPLAQLGLPPAPAGVPLLANGRVLLWSESGFSVAGATTSIGWQPRYVAGPYPAFEGAPWAMSVTGGLRRWLPASADALEGPVTVFVGGVLYAPR
ncbi:MAG: hypothetical protein ACE366_18630 [Bradymonadia bacterium]